jgi:hypothetical protein
LSWGVPSYLLLVACYLFNNSIRRLKFSSGFDHFAPVGGVSSDEVEQAAGDGGGFALAAFPGADEGGGDAEHCGENWLAYADKLARGSDGGGVVSAGVGDGADGAGRVLFAQGDSRLERCMHLF